MSYILTIGGEIALLFAAVCLSYLMLLLYRHPNHAKWLESEFASTTIMLVLMSALIFTLAWLVQGLVALNVDPLAAIAAAVALLIGISWCLWRALNIRARLQAADEGRSPFRLARKPRRGGRGDRPRGPMPTAA